MRSVSKVSIRRKHQQLCQEIRKYNYAYYVQNQSLVDDSYYDQKYRELLAMEEQFKDFLDLDASPTNTLTSTGGSHLAKEQHTHPMLSLDNAWSKEDLQSFIFFLSLVLL